MTQKGSVPRFDLFPITSPSYPSHTKCNDTVFFYFVFLCSCSQLASLLHLHLPLAYCRILFADIEGAVISNTFGVILYS